MREEKRAARALQIEAAAYSVLEQKGYEGMSMLAVARAAKASNETLYRWYGDKTGLFEALIESNTATVSTALDQIDKTDALMALHQLGPQLLRMLLGPRAVALNRAAAADGSGTLGRALGRLGRDTVAPRVMQLMAQAAQQTGLDHADAPQMAETYFALLIGDCQIRRVTGAMPEPDADWIAQRADTALRQLRQLFGMT